MGSPCTERHRTARICIYLLAMASNGRPSALTLKKRSSRGIGTRSARANPDDTGAQQTLLAPHAIYTYIVHMAPTESQVLAFLARLRAAVADGRVEVRAYALAGLRDLEWSTADLKLQLVELTVADLLRTERSSAPQGGLVWVFTPDYWDGGHLWIRIIERAGVVVISFHKG